MESTEARTLKFGSFELDVRLRELRTGSTRVRLQEQPFEILRLMLERPGDVVTREQLRQRLWPAGTYVDFEHSLNAAVKRLRAALGDDADNPRFVETLPRRGYRFIARLDTAGTAAPGASAASTRLRLAVLPFANLSDDPAQEYFSDGLTEEMISQLGSVCRGRIGVVARWSSMVFKGTTRRAREIGETLRRRLSRRRQRPPRGRPRPHHRAAGRDRRRDAPLVRGLRARADRLPDRPDRCRGPHRAFAGDGAVARRRQPAAGATRPRTRPT